MHTVITNIRPWGGPPCDVVLDERSVVEIAAVGSAPTSDATIVDGAGRVAVPSFSDVHTHLDSNRLGLPFRPCTGAPDLMSRIMDDRANWRSAEASVTDRATYALQRAITFGATRVRSHAQVDADSGLAKLEGVLAARETHRDRATVEVVAFPQVGLHREAGVVALTAEALRLGADLVGGIDPCSIDRDPVRHLDTVFDLAERFGCGVDIHLHEPGALGLFSLSLITERTRALGMAGSVTVSHAFCLAEASTEAFRAIDELAELDIALTTIAPGTHGSLPIRRIVDAGVRIGLGMDGQRDYWSPYGNGDMLDRTWQLAFTQGYTFEPDLDSALAVATWGGHAVLDRAASRLVHGERPGLRVGDPAELVLIDAESAAAGVLDRPAGRVTVHHGRVVAENGELR